MSGPLPERRFVVKTILAVGDMDAASDFYRQLGFEINSYDPAYAFVMHNGEEVLHLRHVADLDPASNPGVAYLHMQDVNAWHTAWSDRGVECEPPTDLPWGMREFTLRGPRRQYLADRPEPVAVPNAPVVRRETRRTSSGLGGDRWSQNR